MVNGEIDLSHFIFQRMQSQRLSDGQLISIRQIGIEI